MSDRPRLPPNQGLITRAETWPVVGEAAPRADAAPWVVAFGGLAARPYEIALEELAARPRARRRIDFHCVTRWSKLDMAFEGAPLVPLIDAAQPLPEARYVRFVARSARGHDTSLSLEDVRRLQPLVAVACGGAPLPEAHGGPVRVVTPGKYGYKSLKWLERVELLSENQLGYWERGPGYHDHADPWAEERYVTGSIPPDLRARMIALKRLGGRDLLSVDFSREDLTGLDAVGAVLRNCRFDRARLSHARFDRANLSNASLIEADLSDASFREADLEGADFAGADLRGADFAGASLFGASFVDAQGRAARLAGARIAPEQAARLVDAQAAALRRALGWDA